MHTAGHFFNEVQSSPPPAGNSASGIATQPQEPNRRSDVPRSEVPMIIGSPMFRSSDVPMIRSIVLGAFVATKSETGFHEGFIGLKRMTTCLQITPKSYWLRANG